MALSDTRPAFNLAFPRMLSLLSLGTVARAPEPMRPALDPAALTVGIVHLGVGAFHRAHQAVYTELAADLAGESCWGICGVSERSAGAADALTAQDGLYSVLCTDGAGSSARVIGSLRRALYARRDYGTLTALLAGPAVKVVTLTVTEKGYHYRSGDRRLQSDDPDVSADAGRRPPVTVLGQLARGIEQRRRADGGPLTVVSCDNISGNGRLLRQLLQELMARPGARFDRGLAAWTEDNVRFPCTMVDRIVPTTTEQWRQDVADKLGLRDNCAVVAEPFRQWVIEDDFAAARPAWELAGAELVPDVTPYEALKLRTLNGAHSALAYLGLLVGCDTIAEALARPGLEAFVRSMLDDEVRPTLQLPGSVDFGRYRERVLTRFANPRLPYRCSQVAMDGSQKLPQRVLGTVRDRLTAGTVPRFGVTVLAAWLRCIWTGVDDNGRPFELDDPLAERLGAAMGTNTDAARAVDGALSLEQVFGDLAGDERFRAALEDGLDGLSRAGAQAVVAEMVSHGR